MAIKKLSNYDRIQRQNKRLQQETRGLTFGGNIRIANIDLDDNDDGGSREIIACCQNDDNLLGIAVWLLFGSDDDHIPGISIKIHNWDKNANKINVLERSILSSSLDSLYIEGNILHINYYDIGSSRDEYVNYTLSSNSLSGSIEGDDTGGTELNDDDTVTWNNRTRTMEVEDEKDGTHTNDYIGFQQYLVGTLIV